MSNLHDRLFRDEETARTTIAVGCGTLSLLGFALFQVAFFVLR
jgi:hypothetical protein